MGGELKYYRHTDNRHTDRPSDEAGPRGAFAPNKDNIFELYMLNN